MTLQGILRACDKWAGFYSSTYTMIQSSPNWQITKEEHLMLLRSAYTNSAAMCEHLLGSMKALEPDKEMPFSAFSFVAQGQFTPPNFPPGVPPMQGQNVSPPSEQAVEMKEANSPIGNASN
jgi:hypothetical protein